MTILQDGSEFFPREDRKIAEAVLVATGRRPATGELNLEAAGVELDAGYDVKTVQLPASVIPKAQVLEWPEDLLKAVIDARTGKIVGAHLFCAQSHGLIIIVKLAMDAGLPYTALRV